MGSLQRRIANRFPHVKAAIRPSSYRSGALWIPLLEARDSAKVHPGRSVTAGRLASLFSGFGSDKSTTHDYETPYAQAIAQAVTGPLLEIGIGTNHLDLPSSMGPDGVPGASLRAWAALGVFDHVHGADIDRRILFAEPGIDTHFVDQRDPQSLEDLRAELASLYPSGFSMVVDDGLHATDAIVNSLQALWPLLAHGGIYIIEDMTADILHDVLPAVLSMPGRTDWALWSNLKIDQSNQLVLARCA